MFAAAAGQRLGSGSRGRDRRTHPTTAVGTETGWGMPSIPTATLPSPQSHSSQEKLAWTRPTADDVGVGNADVTSRIGCSDCDADGSACLNAMPRCRVGDGSRRRRTAVCAAGLLHAIACIMATCLYGASLAAAVDFGCATVGTETYVTVPGCGTSGATNALASLGEGLASCVNAGSSIVSNGVVPLHCAQVVPASAPAFFALVINGTETNTTKRQAATDALRVLFAEYSLSGANGTGSSASVVLGGRVLLAAGDCSAAVSVLHDAAASVAGGTYQMTVNIIKRPFFQLMSACYDATLWTVFLELSTCPFHTASMFTRIHKHHAMQYRPPAHCCRQINFTHFLLSYTLLPLY